MRQVETLFSVKWHDSKKWILSVFEFEIKKYIFMASSILHLYKLQLNSRVEINMFIS